MSRFSHESSKRDWRHSRNDAFPAPKWMVEADNRRLEDSLQSLMDAFNDIEATVNPLIEAGVDIERYVLDYPTCQRLSSDFIILYNECEFLENNYSAKFNADLLTYLRHLRRLCAHRFGSSMDASRFLQVAVIQILPMKKPIKSKLYDVLKDNPGTGMEGRVASFNRRSKSHRKISRRW